MLPQADSSFPFQHSTVQFCFSQISHTGGTFCCEAYTCSVNNLQDFLCGWLISLIFIKLLLNLCFVSQAQSGPCVGTMFVSSVEQQQQQRRRQWGPKVVPSRQLDTCPGRTTGWHGGRASLQPPSPWGQDMTLAIRLSVIEKLLLWTMRTRWWRVFQEVWPAHSKNMQKQTFATFGRW